MVGTTRIKQVSDNKTMQAVTVEMLPGIERVGPGETSPSGLGQPFADQAIHPTDTTTNHKHYIGNKQNMKKNRLDRSLGICVIATCIAISSHADPTASNASSSAAGESRPFLKWDGTSLTIGKLPTLDFHGFLSQGYLLSSDYNYLGQTTEGGSFKFTEAGVNTSFSPFERTRISAQGFLFDVGDDVGKYQPILDYAQVEYTFNNHIGVRGGRIRRAQGIYNSIVDVDLARTSVLLPQGMYDSRFRDFYASLDGGEFFGSIPLGKGGSLSYEAYGGIVSPSMNGGITKEFNDKYYGFRVPIAPGVYLPATVQLDSIGSAPLGGVQLWWNTPVDGLRVGGSATYVSGMVFDSTVIIPLAAIRRRQSVPVDFSMYQGSLEYVWKQWTFQTEYMMRTQSPQGETAIYTDSWYVSADRRFNKWFDAGVYYTEYYGDTTQRGNSQKHQKDTALSLRFDLKDWWIFKVEGHYINGTGLLKDSVANPVRDNNGWFMLAVKTTFSF